MKRKLKPSLKAQGHTEADVAATRVTKLMDLYIEAKEKQGEKEAFKYFSSFILLN